MIYIQEKSIDRQIDLLEFYLSQGDYDLIIWLYPESKSRNICGLELAPKELVEGEQITTYGDNFQPSKTRRVKLTSELLNRVRQSTKEIENNCDSLVLYLPGEKNWSLSTIGHEGMCMAQNDELLENLKASNFNATLEAPEGW